MTQTVRQILARIDPRKSPEPLIEGCNRLKQIDALLDELAAAAKPDSDDWSLIYDNVFCKRDDSIGVRTRTAFEMTGVAFPDYYDPDGDYDEDVLAWMRAFKEGLKEVEIRVAEQMAITEAR